MPIAGRLSRHGRACAPPAGLVRDARPRQRTRGASGAPPHRRTGICAGLAACALAALLLAAPAWGSEANTIIQRCIQGQSLSGFSQKGYREALKQMPTEVAEYYDCTTLVHDAQLAAVGGPGTPLGAGAGGGLAGGAGASSNTPIPLTPAEQQEVTRAHRHGSVPVLVGSSRVKPGVVHANVASAASALPTSLDAVLALLLASAAAFAIAEGYKRVRRHR